MAKLVRSPPKYHPSEWHASNELNYTRAEDERSAAERLSAECDRLRKETDATTLRVQQDVEHKLSQRLRDIDFWKEELERKVEENVDETRELLEKKEQLERALVATQFPQQVAQSCLAFREKRQSIDLVHDEVEIQLMKEIEVIEGIQGLLQHTLEQAMEQIRLLRSCKFKLEKDLTDKFQAFKIDGTCAELSDTTDGLCYSQDTIKIQTDSVTPDQWISFSNENILKAERERNASVTLRGVANGVLEQTLQDLEQQRARVNLAFEKRIQETSQAKQSLEQHLDKVLKEVALMEGNIAHLQASVAAKEGPMKLAHTRLDLRSQRPNVELVRDPVQYELIDEVGTIGLSVQKLRERLAESEGALKGLIRSQLTLEEDIALKASSLFIDRDQCVALRMQLEATPP